LNQFTANGGRVSIESWGLDSEIVRQWQPRDHQRADKSEATIGKAQDEHPRNARGHALTDAESQ
jgi:hypothetical protein